MVLFIKEDTKNFAKTPFIEVFLIKVPKWCKKFLKQYELITHENISSLDGFYWSCKLEGKHSNREAYMEKKHNKARRKSKYYIICILLFIVFIIAIWGNTALEVTQITISNNRIPSAFSGFRIAQVSDLHNAEFGENNEILLQKLAESKPDIIVITGDLVDASHTDLNAAIVFVEKATVIAPIYYVTGNHEANITQYDDLKERLEAVGVIVLEDEGVLLEREGKQLSLIGLSDPDFTIKGDLFGEVPAMVATKLKGMEIQETYTILLSHRPELLETYVYCGIDLVLSGHAHGGQFRLPFVGGLIAPNQGFFPKYDAGVYKEANTDLVVSRGIGNSIIPIRFNNRPEIVLVTLEANKKTN